MNQIIVTLIAFVIIFTVLYLMKRGLLTSEGKINLKDEKNKNF